MDPRRYCRRKNHEQCRAARLGKRPKRQGVHIRDGLVFGHQNDYLATSTAPVYKRQLFPEQVLGASVDRGKTLFETDDVRLWNLGGDDIAILSFKTKMHTVNAGVLDGIHQAIDEAERNYQAMVIWQDSAPFSAGANLREAVATVQSGNIDNSKALSLVSSKPACASSIRWYR